jgi:hypothetical protein
MSLTSRWLSVLTVSLLAATGPVLGDAYVNTISGAWNSPATWGGSGWPQNPDDTAAVVTGTVTANSDIPTISQITIGSSGTLHFSATAGNPRTTTNDILMDDGATISSQGNYQGGEVNRVYGTITVNGTANFNTGYAYLSLHSIVSGTGTLAFEGTSKGNGYQRGFQVHGDNTFTGNVTLATSTYVDVRHTRALGLQTNLTVLVVGAATGQDSDASVLTLGSAAKRFATNVSAVVVDGEKAYRGKFYQGSKTLMDTPLYMNGGYYRVGGGGGVCTNAGPIILKTGTVSTMDKSGGYGTWYQIGTISGEGAFRITGYNGNDSTPHFFGDNTYTGGTIVERETNERETWVRHSHALGTGPVVLQCDVDDKAAFRIAGNLTMPNDFRGRGKIETGSYVLTTTGSIGPRDTGLSTVTKNIGTFYVEDLRFGTDTDGCTYAWQYNESVNDVIATTTLQFGSALHTLEVDWLGADSAPAGDYVLFTYSSGPDPVVGDWTVRTPTGCGRVWLDAANNRVMVTLSFGGTVLMLQ